MKFRPERFFDRLFNIKYKKRIFWEISYFRSQKQFPNDHWFLDKIQANYLFISCTPQSKLERNNRLSRVKNYDWLNCDWLNCNRPTQKRCANTDCSKLACEDHSRIVCFKCIPLRYCPSRPGDIHLEIVQHKKDRQASLKTKSYYDKCKMYRTKVLCKSDPICTRSTTVYCSTCSLPACHSHSRVRNRSWLKISKIRLVWKIRVN